MGVKLSLVYLCAFFCIAIATQQPLALTFTTSNPSDPLSNTIIYECESTIGSYTVSVSECSFVFLRPDGETEMTGILAGHKLKLNFSVTPSVEAKVFCRCGSLVSLNLSVAAIQDTMNTTEETVIRENETVPVTLYCPFVLGNLHDSSELQYQVCWRNGTTCLQNSSNIILSWDNKTLETTIEKPESNHKFECTFYLQRCNLKQCHTRAYGNVAFIVKVFDVLTITQNITQYNNGGNLNFSCLANGTNISSRWFVDGEEPDPEIITTINQPQGQVSTLTLNPEFGDGESVSIVCRFEQHLPNNTFLMMNRSMVLLRTSPTGGPTQTVSESPVTPSPTNSSLHLIIAVPIAIIAVICILITFLCCCYCWRRGTKETNRYTVETPSNLILRQRPKRVPIYEELPGPILGTEPQLMRQIGIGYDPTCKHEDGSYQGSDEPLCVGSDVSGLSGVSGNIPGAHRMPIYNAEDSIPSDNFLQPPHPPKPSKNVSSSTFDTTATQSTVIGSGSFSDVPYNGDPRQISSEVHYPHFPHAITERRHSYSDHPSGGFSDHFHHCPSCHSHNQQIPFNNTPIAHSVDSSSSSLHKPAASSASSRSNSMNNSPYHHSADFSPYHHNMNPSPSHHHHGMHSSPCHHHTCSNGHMQHNQPSIPELANYLLNKVKHNRNCKLPGCFCKSLKDFNNIEDGSISKMHNSKRRKPASTVTSSSTESESDTPNHKSKKKTMHLELKKDQEEELYPHYHLSTRSHAIHSSQRRVNSKKRRSQSLTDLTPITETRETPTPMVGGAVLAGTPVYPPKSLGDDGQVGEHYIAPSKQALLHPGPVGLLTRPRPQLLRQTSISIDNVPVLCLNDCVAKLTTPSPTKQSIYLTNKVSMNDGVLKTVQERASNSESEVSSTSSRSKSPPETEAVKSSQSDNEDTFFRNQDPSLGREGSGYESGGGETVSLRSSQKTESCSYGRVESSGYESGEGSVLLHRAEKVSDNMSKTTNGLNIPLPLPVDPVGPSHLAYNSVHHYSTSSPKENLTAPLRTHNSPIPSRSPSPFETETEVREDGTKIQTTEC